MQWFYSYRRRLSPTLSVGSSPLSVKVISCALSDKLAKLDGSSFSAARTLGDVVVRVEAGSRQVSSEATRRVVRLEPSQSRHAVCSSTFSFRSTFCQKISHGRLSGDSDFHVRHTVFSDDDGLFLSVDSTRTIGYPATFDVIPRFKTVISMRLFAFCFSS